MNTHIALLRGINVTGANRMPMAELRGLCVELGWKDVETYIASGNVVFEAPRPRGRAHLSASDMETALERAIQRHFGFVVPVIVRPGADWVRFVEGNPFLYACEAEPNLVMLAMSKSPLRDDALGTLRSRAAGGERIERVDDVLWIHFNAGVARSKLSPGMLDRLAGSPVTTRNWRTVARLGTMVREREKAS